MDCVFCKIVAWVFDAKENYLYEDEKVLVMLDNDYVVKWHALVIWKGHFTNLSDLSEEDFAYFSQILHRSEKTLLKLCGKWRSINLKSWWLHPHFHFHIYPIDLEMPWRDIHDMIEKDEKHRQNTFFYEYLPWEKQKLIEEFKENFNK